VYDWAEAANDALPKQKEFGLRVESTRNREQIHPPSAPSLLQAPSLGSHTPRDAAAVPPTPQIQPYEQNRTDYCNTPLI
jgi:hypothetical protein